MNHWIPLLTFVSDLSLTSQVNNSVSNFMLNNLSCEISKSTSVCRDFLVFNVWLKSKWFYNKKLVIGYGMAGILGLQCTVCFAVHQQCMAESIYISSISLIHGKNTSIIPILHILRRRFSSNLMCHLLIFNFFFPCLATRKSKEQLPYSWSMKVPVPICMGNIQLHLTSAFLNSVIYWCSSYRSLSC